jgi:hypothetical protein
VLVAGNGIAAGPTCDDALLDRKRQRSWSAFGVECKRDSGRHCRILGNQFNRLTVASTKHQTARAGKPHIDAISARELSY